MISLNRIGIKMQLMDTFRLTASAPIFDGIARSQGHTSVHKSSYRSGNRKNDFLTILICWLYANYRNPTGYPQRSRDVKSSVASYPSSGQIFGTSTVETLRIAFRKENPIDLFEVSQGSREGRETSGQGVDRHIHVSFAV